MYQASFLQQKSYSSKQCHVQILDLDAENFIDTFDNIDNKSFGLIREGILFSIWKMDTQHCNMSVTLTITPTRSLHSSDYEKILTTLRESPKIKLNSIVESPDKRLITADSIDDIRKIKVRIHGANAFEIKNNRNDDSFESVEDLTQQMKQCAAIAAPKKTPRRFDGCMNQPY